MENVKREINMERTQVRDQRDLAFLEDLLTLSVVVLQDLQPGGEEEGR